MPLSSIIELFKRTEPSPTDNTPLGQIWYVIYNVVYGIACFIEFWYMLAITFVYRVRNFTLIKPQKNLAGEVVLITGGGSGLGALMAEQFAKEKSVVVLWDVNQAGLQQTVKKVKELGGTVFTYVVDISDAAKVAEVAAQVQKEVGHVTILINNAGIVSGKTILECTEAQMDRTLKVNTSSHFWTVRAFLPHMLETKHGHIVTIASAAGILGVSGLVDYSASKFAAFGFGESLRMELRKQGLNNHIRSLCVCPFFINTGMFDGAKTLSPFLLPMLDPEYVVSKIMRAIKNGDEMLIMPRFVKWVWCMRFLFSTDTCDKIAEVLGMNNSMEDFKGRQGAAAAKKTN